MQRFIRERLVPAENDVEEDDEVPAALVEDMKEMGLFGLSIPEEYGGYAHLTLPTTTLR